jgi:hypothetical protein
VGVGAGDVEEPPADLLQDVEVKLDILVNDVDVLSGGEGSVKGCSFRFELDKFLQFGVVVR